MNWKMNLKEMPISFEYLKIGQNDCSIFQTMTMEIDKLSKILYERFAWYLKDLITVCLYNFKLCQDNSREKEKGNAEQTRLSSWAKDNVKATGFMDTWKSGSLQMWLTGLMFDVFNMFTSVEKNLKKSNLIIPDIITVRDAAIRKVHSSDTISSWNGRKRSCARWTSATKVMKIVYVNLEQPGSRSCLDSHFGFKLYLATLKNWRRSAHKKHDSHLWSKKLSQFYCGFTWTGASTSLTHQSRKWSLRTADFNWVKTGARNVWCWSRLHSLFRQLICSTRAVVSSLCYVTYTMSIEWSVSHYKRKSLCNETIIDRFASPLMK